MRRSGRSYAHPLVVLVALANEVAKVHVGVAAGRTVGSAVKRNRAKRLLREGIRPLLPLIPPGWDLVFIARGRLVTTAFQDVQTALEELLQRAGLLTPAVLQGENVR